MNGAIIYNRVIPQILRKMHGNVYKYRLLLLTLFTEGDYIYIVKNQNIRGLSRHVVLSLHQRQITEKCEWQNTDTFYMRQMIQQSEGLKKTDVAGYS